MASDGLTPLRESYKEQTRARILDAALAQMVEVGEDSVTIADVADRANVSERTVYRHFQTRDALVKSAWGRLLRRLEVPPNPRTADELIDAPLVRFPKFDDERDLVRANLYSRARREARVVSNKTRENEMLACVQSELPSLAEDKLRRRAAIAELLTSAYAWDLMYRLWGFDGIEAGDAAAEALLVLLGREPAG